MTNKHPEALRLAEYLTDRNRLDLTCDEAAAELRRLHEQNERLIRIIDSRPAINAGLPQTYIDWSRSIYAMDYHHASENVQ